MSTGSDDTVVPTAARSELSAFQRRILAVLAGNSSYGLAIKRALEEYYAEEVTHGRVYANLDDLVEIGFVEKSQRDRRTNEYALSDTATAFLENEREWFDQQVNGGDSR